MYPSTSLFIAIGQAAIVILVLFSYALQVQPCRNCLDKVFGSHSTPWTPPKANGTHDELEEIEDELTPPEMGLVKHAILTTLIVLFGYAIAYNVDDLQIGMASLAFYTSPFIYMHDTVLAFVGSTGSTTISFILPGLFYWKLFKEDQSPRTRMLRKAAAALTVYGILVLIFWYVVFRRRWRR
jgi:hypothetical protein